MRRILILLSTCLMLLVGVAAPAGATSDTPRPFAGTASGPLEFLPTQPPRVCPAPPFLTTTVTKIPGTARHLGRMSLSSQHCAALGPFGPGTMTMVAANGDELHMTYTGMSPMEPSPAFTVTTDATIVGGTGRFEDAKGDVDLIGYVVLPDFPSFAPASIRFVWTGRITY